MTKTIRAETRLYLMWRCLTMSGDCHLLSMFYSGQSISCHFYYFFIINGLAELTGMNTNKVVVSKQRYGGAPFL